MRLWFHSTVWFVRWSEDDTQSYSKISTLVMLQRKKRALFVICGLILVKTHKDMPEKILRGCEKMKATCQTVFYVKETALVDPDLRSVMTVSTGFPSFYLGRRSTMSIAVNTSSPAGEKKSPFVHSCQIDRFYDIRGNVSPAHRRRLPGAACGTATSGCHLLSFLLSVFASVISGHYAVCHIAESYVPPIAMRRKMGLIVIEFRFRETRSAFLLV